MNISEIPIVIICYNNYKYVDMMVKQIEMKSREQKIIIINNNSRCTYTKQYLVNQILNHQVIHLNENKGHTAWRSPEIYDTLPNQFIITDPDIQFNTNLPDDYINQMITLSTIYKSGVIGFALDISDKDKMFTYKFTDFGYSGITTIWESQEQYWKNRIPDNEYELYSAPIDTTFALYTKSYNNSNHIRIAGNFTSKHIPWYIDNSDISLYARYLMYNEASSSSSIKCFILQYIKDNIIMINKRNTTLFFEKNVNDNFWMNIYPTWENDTFEVFDKYLNKDKQFLDIGAWMGTTALYASKRSSYVVAVECDVISIEKLKNNIKLNYVDTVIDVEPCAIYSHDTEVAFGPNSTSKTSQLNDSMSQIKSTVSDKDYNVKTITLESIITKYKLHNLSLIKVDIEGGEENILVDLFKYCRANNVPLYLSFHYSWWTNKNLDRFSFIKDEHKKQILADPFCSIVFDFSKTS